jgi:hypothetical protein
MKFFTFEGSAGAWSSAIDEFVVILTLSHAGETSEVSGSLNILIQ